LTEHHAITKIASHRWGLLKAQGGQQKWLDLASDPAARLRPNGDLRDGQQDELNADGEKMTPAPAPPCATAPLALRGPFQQTIVGRAEDYVGGLVKQVRLPASLSLRCR
jgi:hypothetical protein